MGLLIYILINGLTLGYFGVKLIQYHQKTKLQEQALKLKMQTYLLSFQNDRNSI